MMAREPYRVTLRLANDEEWITVGWGTTKEAAGEEARNHLADTIEIKGIVRVEDLPKGDEARRRLGEFE